MTSKFHFRVISEFNVEEFNRLYDDCKKSIEQNIDWKKETTCGERRKNLETYFRGFFGYKARLQGKIVYGAYHEDDPSRLLIMCAGIIDEVTLTLKIDLTLFGKNKYGSKRWVLDFFKNGDKTFKNFVYSLGLIRWYYYINNDSDFVDKKLYGISGVLRDVVQEDPNYVNFKKMITSAYGWK